MIQKEIAVMQHKDNEISSKYREIEMELDQELAAQLGAVIVLEAEDQETKNDTFTDLTYIAKKYTNGGWNTNLSIGRLNKEGDFIPGKGNAIALSIW